jgi:hypothetical protein
MAAGGLRRCRGYANPEGSHRRPQGYEGMRTSFSQWPWYALSTTVWNDRCVSRYGASLGSLLAQVGQSPYALHDLVSLLFGDGDEVVRQIASFS